MIESELAASLLNNQDSLERENAKLKRIVGKLMVRVEQATSDQSQGYVHFERAIALEDEVRSRTLHLHETMEVLHATNAQLTKAQRETEKARKELNYALETIQDGFAIFNAEGYLVMKNSRFSKLLPDVLPLLKRGISFKEYVTISASSEHMFRPENRSLEDWVVHRMDVHNRNLVNFTLAIKDDLWMQVSEQRMPDGGTIVVQTDITDHVRREREEHNKILDSQSLIVKATLEHIEQGVLIFDSSQKLVEWNRAALLMLNIPRHKVVLAAPLELFEREFGEKSVFLDSCHADLVFNWLRQGVGRRPLRHELVTRAGSYFQVLGQEMDDGSTVISFSDISTLKRAYQQLHQVNTTLEQRVGERTLALQAARDEAERANASKSRFVAAASHDLLQPLNAAKLFISSLEQTDLDDKQAKVVDRIAQSFHSVETILDALLDISKLDLGQANLSVSEFPLDPILNRLRQEFEPVALAKGLTLRIVSSGIYLKSDPVYVRRILQNLLSNAIRYTETGKVLLGVRRRNDHARIVVMDTGVGIAEVDRQKVFQEFHRVDGTKFSESAMGLGLAIVDRACRMLNHPIELDSQLGLGSSFSVSVPYGGDCIADLSEKSTPADTVKLSENALVMVIENDLQVADGMARVIDGWGAAPVTVDNYEQAIASIDELGMQPDVFLVDYHLDDKLNGIETILQLREIHGPNKAVLLTADRSTEVQRQAHSQGIFVRYKPIDLQDIESLLWRMMN